ncbi:hypothetical protein [Metabacillus endolithicus]|uniref:Uncharacterized protein n=1 Tax=Metabacillus endolithicus TaxID=1535204 RepID=A0ABW5BUQ9_9BACI|nr:hypothetical protein [Metabacillus endolithicus]UPG62883.1 hypothetical protein MVE64_21205 [Metabacillus endolithicus]
MNKKIQNKDHANLNFMHTEIAMNELKTFFEHTFSETLNLLKVSSPIQVHKDKKDLHSFIDWKRTTLFKYGFTHGEGLYTNLRSLKINNALEQFNSFYTEEWEWEKIILEKHKSIEYLITEVKNIYSSIKKTEDYMNEFHPSFQPVLPKDFLTLPKTELEKAYPDTTLKDAEEKLIKRCGAVFFLNEYKSTNDESSTSGFMKAWNPLLKKSVTLFSIGIRADIEKCSSVGGKVNQTNLCMLLLKKLNNNEVRPCSWKEENDVINISLGTK